MTGGEDDFDIDLRLGEPGAASKETQTTRPCEEGETENCLVEQTDTCRPEQTQGPVCDSTDPAQCLETGDCEETRLTCETCLAATCAFTCTPSDCQVEPGE